MMKAGFKLYGGGQNHQIPPLAGSVAVLAIYSVQPGLERKIWKIIRQKRFIYRLCFTDCSESASLQLRCTCEEENFSKYIFQYKGSAMWMGDF